MTRRYYGANFNEKNRYFSELPPEERRRYFQEIVSALAQGARAVGDLTTRFDSYPGLEQFTADVDNYSVLDGNYFYFDLPFTPSLFPVGADRRALPLFISRGSDYAVRTEIELPPGFHRVVMAPGSETLDAPDGSGSAKITSTDSAGKLVITDEFGNRARHHPPAGLRRHAKGRVRAGPQEREGLSVGEGLTVTSIVWNRRSFPSRRSSSLQCGRQFKRFLFQACSHNAPKFKIKSACVRKDCSFCGRLQTRVQVFAMLKAAFARILSGFSLALLLAGCAAPGPRSRYLDQIEPPSLTNLLAYRIGTNLQIRIPLRGKDAFARASWAAPEAGATNYQHRVARLEFEPETLAARRFLTIRANRLAVHDIRQWQQVLRQIFSGLVPARPDHGVLLFVQNQEIVVFTDKSGKPAVVKLENKPPESQSGSHLQRGGFHPRGHTIAGTGARFLRQGQTEFLFVTGEDPAFVLVDVRQRLRRFPGLSGRPGDCRNCRPGFAVRALNSLVIRSLVVTAVKNPVTLLCRGFWHMGTSGAAAIATGPESSGGPPRRWPRGPGMDLAAWEKELDRIVSARRYKGRARIAHQRRKVFPGPHPIGSQGAARSVDVAGVYI